MAGTSGGMSFFKGNLGGLECMIQGMSAGMEQFITMADFNQVNMTSSLGHGMASQKIISAAAFNQMNVSALMGANITLMLNPTNESLFQYNVSQEWANCNMWESTTMPMNTGQTFLGGTHQDNMEQNYAFN